MTAADEDRLLIKEGLLLTMNPQQPVVRGDLLISDGQITEIASQIEVPAERSISAQGRLVMPGFVQTHVHLCQTLYRGLGGDLDLLHWLSDRIKPLEAASDTESVYASARLGLAELIKGGTTTVADFGPLHYADRVCQAVAESGLRAQCSKMLMDQQAPGPEGYLQDIESAVDESMTLVDKWRSKKHAHVEVALAPRGLLSCTEDLLKSVASLAQRHALRVHTHVAENPRETEFIAQERGETPLRYLAKLGLTGSTLQAAHCVWIDDEEMNLLASSSTNVLHCPSSNLKLASGIARIPEMRQRGVCVSLGADGAACNDTLDAFVEMRLAALIQKPRVGATALPASEVLRMATSEGARALGLDRKIGRIEVGMQADLIIIDQERLHLAPMNIWGPDVSEGDGIAARLVYSARADDVLTTIVGGQILMEDRNLVTLDENQILQDAKISMERVAKRLGWLN